MLRQDKSVFETIRLLCTDCINDGHLMDSLGRTMDRKNRRDHDCCYYKCEHSQWKLPRISPVRSYHFFKQDFMQRQAYEASHNAPGDGICDGFGSNHLYELMTAHADGAHSTVLFDTRRNTHGDAVCYIKYGD